MLEQYTEGGKSLAALPLLVVSGLCGEQEGRSAGRCYLVVIIGRPTTSNNSDDELLEIVRGQLHTATVKYRVVGADSVNGLGKQSHRGGELDDSARMKTFSQSGEGLFFVPKRHRTPGLPAICRQEIRPRGRARRTGLCHYHRQAHEPSGNNGSAKPRGTTCLPEFDGLRPRVYSRSNEERDSDVRTGDDS
jgi:hypothetical protein